MQPFRKTPWAWGPTAGALLLFTIVYITGTNHSLFLQLNHFGHVFGNVWWTNVTILGDGAVALALILPSIRRAPQHFWAALIAAAFATLWVQVCKHSFNVPRPLSVFPVSLFFHTGPGFRAASFPSGHATAIFALTGIWIISLSRRYLLRSALFVLAIVVSLSRVMVGVHWPLDIVGGMLGGWLSAWAGLALSARCQWGTSCIAGYIAGVALIAVTLVLLVGGHTGYPEAILLQRALGAMCLIFGARDMYLTLTSRRSLKGERKD